MNIFPLLREMGRKESSKLILIWDPITSQREFILNTSAGGKVAKIMYTGKLMGCLLTASIIHLQKKILRGWIHSYASLFLQL